MKDPRCGCETYHGVNCAYGDHGEVIKEPVREPIELLAKARGLTVTFNGSPDSILAWYNGQKYTSIPDLVRALKI